MVRFSLFGIPIEIRPWFWITMIIFGSLWTGSGSSRDAVILIALFVIAGSLSILVHELGHALVGRAFGAPTGIVLEAFGGYAAFPAGAFTRGQNFLVTAAGPGIQLIWGGIFLLILLFGNLPDTMIQRFVTYSVAVSFIWAIFNLLPVLPLDGGRLVEHTLGPKRTRTTLWISFATAVVITVLGVIYKQYFIALFLGSMAYQNWQAIQQHR
ncbi:site-2 protease family protein [Haloferula chungangensis]|uniref:Site-2 protease family protein n=1 Tax=Haloferula chungangensis TaxID=1048331 RepID=A0ABW2LD82_9BACT